MPIPDHSALLTEKDVMRLLNVLSRETIARMVRRGQLPKPITIGGGRKRWLPEELGALIMERADARAPIQNVLFSQARPAPRIAQNERGAQRHG